MTHLQLSWFLVYPLLLVFFSLCPFTHWLWSRLCSFCLFHRIWYATPILPDDYLSLFLWPLLCFHSFVSHSQQQSGSSLDMSWYQCLHVSPHHLLSWFLLSFPVSVYTPFIELSRVYKCALIYAELMPKKTQVRFLFHYWGFCRTKKTEGKQEKSVLLFRSKSQGKRDRKQHKGGYDGIFHCDIVNCCSYVLNKLNRHHYLVAGVLHFL